MLKMIKKKNTITTNKNYIIIEIDVIIQIQVIEVLFASV